MIKLRNLKKKDAPFMIEWMHDVEIQKCFQKNMLGMTLEDAVNFCEKSNINNEVDKAENLHFAIVDENDEYFGTISLKEIDYVNKTAEYAISTRRIAQGKGVAKEATFLILKKAFLDLGLHKVYLNVLSDNNRAIKFYEKCGFAYEGEFKDCIYDGYKFKSLKWYAIFQDEFNKRSEI